MGRLFAGTAYDRPPRCERCDRLVAECTCPPVVAEVPRTPPELQTARLRIEKRPKGKFVTVVLGLDPVGNDLESLAATLKGKCGSGGTVKDGQIELQGTHLEVADSALRSLGYKTRRV